jgi:transcriptional regulator with XRE-family HTH domain
MSDIGETFSAAVRAARKQKGWSQMKLAEALEASVDAVSALERDINSPSLATTAALVRVLAIDANKLFGAPVRRAASPERLTSEAALARLAEGLTDDGVVLLLELARSVAKLHTSPGPPEA